MSMKAVTNAGEYTEKILSENFTNIAKGFKAMDNRMDALDNGLRHMSGHIAELYQMAEEAAKTAAKVKTPGRVKPFVLGAAVGFVAYRYVKNNQRKIEEIQKAAKEQVESFLAANTGAGAPKPQ